MKSANLRSAALSGAVLIAMALPAGGGHAQSLPLGAELAPLIALARAQHPEVAAAALEADMVAARASAADSLPDPMFRAEFNDSMRGDDLWPNRLGSRTYMVEQAFPLGGKRDLRRAVALGEQAEADGRRRSVAEDLVLRVKTAQARRYGAAAALRLLEQQQALLRRTGEAVDRAYAQGRIGQEAALAARLDLSRQAIEIARLEGERMRLDARLNGLLGRDAATPLAPAAGFAPVPPQIELDPDSLLVLARERSPDLAQLDARIGRTTQQRRLADAEWVPDVSIGVGIVEEDVRVRAYEAVVAFNIPLRWGLRDASAAAATAGAAAARARRSAIELDIAARLREAVADLAAARRIEALVVQQSLPQARAGVEALSRGLEQGGGRFADVLQAQAKLRDLELERLKAQVEQRVALAEIERLIGSEL